MISRVADSCFWFGRYVERAESTARVLLVTLQLALDAELSPRASWFPVLLVSGEAESFVRLHGEAATADGEVVQRYMTFRSENFAAIRSSVAAARENVRSIREVVSLEAWETVNQLHLWLQSEASERDYRDDRYGFYRRIRESCQLCLGLLRSTMLHDTPLDFIWLGVLLERVSQTARILDVHHHALTELAAHQVVETSLWLSLLRALAGSEPYMRIHQGRVSGPSVAAFLLLEPRFPRSIRYCVHSAHDRLCAIRPPENKRLPGGEALERLRVLDQWLAGLGHEQLDPAQIHDLLTHVIDETAVVCDRLGRELLGHG